MRRENHANGLQTWHFLFPDTGVLAALSTRGGGVSGGSYRSLNLGYHVGDDPQAVAENRARLRSALAISRLTVADQQHGRRVAVVDTELSGAGHSSHADSEARLPGVDAMVTNLPEVPLCIMVADCAPVVLVDPNHGVIGVAHAGRNGVVLDVLGATVDTMRSEFGSEPAELMAGIGPSIKGACYEIGGDALESTREALGDELLTPTSPGHASFDLLEGVRLRLEAAGVKPTNIEQAGTTTTDAPDLFFSDRRERPCGRFMLVAALRQQRRIDAT